MGAAAPMPRCLLPHHPRPPARWPVCASSNSPVSAWPFAGMMFADMGAECRRRPCSRRAGRKQQGHGPAARQTLAGAGPEAPSMRSPPSGGCLNPPTRGSRASAGRWSGSASAGRGRGAAPAARLRLRHRLGPDRPSGAQGRRARHQLRRAERRAFRSRADWASGRWSRPRCSATIGGGGMFPSLGVVCVAGGAALGSRPGWSMRR